MFRVLVLGVTLHAGFLASGPACAAVIGDDGFEYPAGDLDGQDGGSL